MQTPKSNIDFKEGGHREICSAALASKTIRRCEVRFGALASEAICHGERFFVAIPSDAIFLFDFLPSQGRTKEWFPLFSPFQGETQRGFQLVETSPQPSPERRGRSISSPFRGGQKEGFPLSSPHLRGRIKEGVSTETLSRRALLRSSHKRSHLPLLKAQDKDLRLLPPTYSVNLFSLSDRMKLISEIV